MRRFKRRLLPVLVKLHQSSAGHRAIPRGRKDYAAAMYFQESPKSLLSRFAFAELIRAISRLQNAFAVTVATSVRIGHFPDLPEKADVTDYFQRGGTLAELEQLAAATETERPIDSTRRDVPTAIIATPYSWTGPEKISRRDFV